MSSRAFITGSAVLVALLLGSCQPSDAERSATATARIATSDALKAARYQTQTAEPRPTARENSSQQGVQKPSIPSCSFWENNPTNDPVAWTKGTGTINVYGGVDEPRTNEVKGTITSGAVMRVECKSGSWYRVQGVDWWGWLKAANIQF